VGAKYSQAASICNWFKAVHTCLLASFDNLPKCLSKRVLQVASHMMQGSSHSCNHQARQLLSSITPVGSQLLLASYGRAMPTHGYHNPGPNQALPQLLCNRHARQRLSESAALNTAASQGLHILSTKPATMHLARCSHSRSCHIVPLAWVPIHSPASPLKLQPASGTNHTALSLSTALSMHSR
jgi:hypothetical protein